MLWLKSAVVCLFTLTAVSAEERNYCDSDVGKLVVYFPEFDYRIPAEACGKKLADGTATLFRLSRPDVYFQQAPSPGNYTLIFVQRQEDSQYYLIWMIANVRPNERFLTRGQFTTLASYDLPAGTETGYYTFLAFRQKSVLDPKRITQRNGIDFESWIESIEELEREPAATFELPAGPEDFRFRREVAASPEPPSWENWNFPPIIQSSANIHHAGLIAIAALLASLLYRQP